MLVTRFRDKIGGPWSYPVGAEALSRGLEGTLRGPLLSVGFYKLPDRVGDGTCAVMSADYHPGYRGFNADTRMALKGPQWSIGVHAVPRVPVRRIRELIGESGMAAVAVWLNTERPPTWLLSRHSIRLRFDPGALVLQVTEE